MGQFGMALVWKHGLEASADAQSFYIIRTLIVPEFCMGVYNVIFVSRDPVEATANSSYIRYH